MAANWQRERGYYPLSAIRFDRWRRHAHLRPIRRFGLTFIPLTQRRGGLQTYKVIHPPARRARTRIDPQTHDGYEWLYVLNGRIDLVLGHEQLTLAPGEAAEFDTRTPHWIGNTTSTTVELLMMFGHQGERTHLAYPSTTG